MHFILLSSFYEMYDMLRLENEGQMINILLEFGNGCFDIQANLYLLNL